MIDLDTVVSVARSCGSSVRTCLQLVCCAGRIEHEGCSEVQLFMNNTDQMMRSLMYALGEDGAATEDLAEVVANGGVLLAGTSLMHFASFDRPHPLL